MCIPMFISVLSTENVMVINDKIIQFAAVCMKLEVIMPSKASQKEMER